MEVKDLSGSWLPPSFRDDVVRLISAVQVCLSGSLLSTRMPDLVGWLRKSLSGTSSRIYYIGGSTRGWATQEEIAEYDTERREMAVSGQNQQQEKEGN